MGTRRDAQELLIARASPRALFARWLAQAIDGIPTPPTPLAVAYLIDLLDERVRAPASPGQEPPTLAEAWWSARAASGAARVRRLRGLGDRALFVSGFFAESLERGVVSGRYYRDMGRSAYAAVAASLGAEATGPEPVWPRLFEELADRFGDLASVLEEIGERAVGRGPGRLLDLYARYLATGSARDRRRLVRAGVPLPAGSGRRWQ